MKKFLCAVAFLAIWGGAVADDEYAPPDDRGLIERYSSTAQDLLNRGLSFIGIRYRLGGNSPAEGFDCSGFVSHVFKDVLGLQLPRTAKSMSLVGTPVEQRELRPGDLVFFNTLRRTFSHVGIYLGENRFLHAPSSGGRVRIDDISEKYWAKRFNGGRRVAPE